MTKSFDDLKKHAIQDILSVNGKDKTSRVIENHMNNLIEIAFVKCQYSQQAEIDELKWLLKNANAQADEFCKKSLELQKRIDEALKMADESCGVNIPAFVKLNKILKGESNDH